MAVDVGSSAIDRATTEPAGYSLIELANPAEASGTLNEIKIWANSNITGLKVATVYLVSGTTYKVRAVYTVGAITAGSEVTKSVSLSIQSGDLIACYFSDGLIEAGMSGGSGVRVISGDHLTVDEESDFTGLDANWIMSLNGDDAGSGGGWSNIAKYLGVASANISKVNGVAKANIAKINGKAV